MALAPILDFSCLVYPWSMGTLWSLPAGSEAPGNSFEKSSPHTKKFNIDFGFWQVPSATPGEMHRDFCTSSFSKVSLCKLQCWETPQVSTGAGSPASKKSLRSALLKRGKEQRSPKGLLGLLVSNKTALQTPSKGCLRFPAFSSTPSQQKPFTNITQAAS